MRYLLAGLVSVVVMLVSGCNNGDSKYQGKTPAEEMETPTPEAPVSFTAFVQTQFEATADSTDPVEINDLTFSFPDDQETTANAFDSLF